MKNVFALVVILSLLTIPTISLAADELPTSPIVFDELTPPTESTPTNDISSQDDAVEETKVEASTAPSNCAEPYANQIIALRNAQLNIRHPDNGRTLKELKNDHDKKVAQLILLKGLQQIRGSYLASLEKHTTDLSKKIKTLQGLKDFALSTEEDIRATERMLIMEKGISDLGNTQAKSKEEFYNQMIKTCKEEFYTQMITPNKDPQNLIKIGTSPASSDICFSLSSPKHKEMIFGFYNAYIKTDKTAEDNENYLSYLRMVADENRLDNQLESLSTLKQRIEETTARFTRCTKTKGQDCELFSGEATVAYKEYRASLYVTPVIANSEQTSLVLENDDQTKTLQFFEDADRKIDEVKEFFDDIKLGDQKTTSDLDSAALLDDLNKKLAHFEKKTKHGIKDYSDILKGMRCNGDIFVGEYDSSKEKDFNKCIKNISDKVLNAKIAELSKSIEEKRKKISSITSSPRWWENGSKKLGHQKYVDLSTAINQVVNIMQRDCKMDTLKFEDTYALQACGINDFLPPEQAKNLSSDVDKILDGIQISSINDEGILEDICSRIRDYGAAAPAALCYGGYDGKSPPGEQVYSSNPQTPYNDLGTKANKAIDPNQLSTPPNKSEQNNNDKQTRRLANGLNATKKSQTRRSSFTAGDYAKAIAKAVSNSPSTMSALTMWAQSPTFKNQLNWQVEMAKQQMDAEAYQKGWLDYYSQAQQNAWLNFLGSSQGVPLYNGGVFYNFGSTTTMTTN